MKKFWSIVLFFTLTLCIIGCGIDNKEEDEFDIAEWSVPDDFFDDVKD